MRRIKAPPLNNFIKKRRPPNTSAVTFIYTIHNLVDTVSCISVKEVTLGVHSRELDCGNHGD